MKRWQFWLGVVISAACLWLALRGLKLDEVWEALQTANYLWLIPGVAVYFVGVWARAWRWHYLLKPIKSIPTHKMFPIVTIGYMGNNIFPARAGEVLRAYILRRQEGVPVSASLATILIERIFDGVVMLMFVFVNLNGLAQLTGDSGVVGSIQVVALIGTGVFFAALGVFLLMAMFPQPSLALFQRFGVPLIPQRFRMRAVGLLTSFWAGLESLRSPLSILMVFLTSIVVWLLETAKYWFVMFAFNFKVSFFALMLMNGIANLFTTIPAAPGNVGTFDLPGIAVLKAYNVSQAVATSYTLTLHAALWLPITLVGLYFMARAGLSWNKVQAEYTEIQGAGAENPAMKIAIIGAGPAGLAAAYDLTRDRDTHQVTIYEAAPEVGGLASGFKAPHWEWSLEKFYHHWFASDSAILGLIHELGWSDQVLFPRPYTVAFINGKFQPLDSPLQALKFFLGNFSLIDTFRFGVATLYLRISSNWPALEKVTAEAWTRRWYGERVYNALWRPLLVGKFGEDNLRVVNMAWLWARLHARTTRLGTFTGGFQAFLDKLAEVVRQQGVTIRLNSAVTEIKQEEAGLRVTTAHGTEMFDVALSTSSPMLMARIAPDLPADYTAKLTALKSMGAVVMVLTLKHKLTNYYWHNLPKEAGFPFLALVEHTNYMDAKHYGGDTILYCGDYLEPDHEYFQLSKDELLEKFLPALARFNPAFDRNWVKESWLWKTAYAQPVPPLNHSRNIPGLRTPVKGLYFASMSQVYPWDRGTNFAVEIGRRVAKMVIEDHLKREG